MHFIFLLMILWLLVWRVRVSRAASRYLEACELSPWVDVCETYGIDAVPPNYRKRVVKLLARHGMKPPDARIANKEVVIRPDERWQAGFRQRPNVSRALPSLARAAGFVVSACIAVLLVAGFIAPSVPNVTPSQVPSNGKPVSSAIATWSTTVSPDPLVLPANKSANESDAAYSARINAYVAEKTRRLAAH